MKWQFFGQTGLEGIHWRDRCRGLVAWEMSERGAILNFIAFQLCYSPSIRQETIITMSGILRNKVAGFWHSFRLARRCFDHGHCVDEDGTESLGEAARSWVEGLYHSSVWAECTGNSCSHDVEVLDRVCWKESILPVIDHSGTMFCSTNCFVLALDNHNSTNYFAGLKVGIFACFFFHFSHNKNNTLDNCVVDF